ncbi:MAG: hypothetical protein WCH60_02180 [Burkholderiales bacterium]
MTIWKNCRADLYYNDGTPELKDPGYEVRLSDTELVISYEGDDGWVNWKGHDLGGGHFEMVSPEVEGRALLHRFGDSEILEGNWTEGGDHGMWRIYLIA